MQLSEEVAADTVEVRGLETAYRRAGEGDPILYLHGIGMTQRWLPFYEQLAQGADLIVPEHPGFGDTPLPEWLEDFDDLVLHYAELLDLLELERVDLVGYSFGGWIAAEFAAFYPERLRSITLIAPMGLRVPGHTPTDVFRMDHARFVDLCFNGRGAEYADYTEYGEETMFQAYAEMTAFARVAWNPRYDRKLDRRLGRVAAPALVLGAEDDRVLPRAHVERYAELLPKGRVEIVAGDGEPTGHGLVAHAPGQVAAAVQEMIGGRR